MMGQPQKSHILLLFWLSLQSRPNQSCKSYLIQKDIGLEMLEEQVLTWDYCTSASTLDRDEKLQSTQERQWGYEINICNADGFELCTIMLISVLSHTGMEISMWFFFFIHAFGNETILQFK